MRNRKVDKCSYNFHNKVDGKHNSNISFSKNSISFSGLPLTKNYSCSKCYYMDAIDFYEDGNPNETPLSASPAITGWPQFLRGYGVPGPKG